MREEIDDVPSGVGRIMFDQLVSGPRDSPEKGVAARDDTDELRHCKNRPPVQEPL